MSKKHPMEPCEDKSEVKSEPSEDVIILGRVETYFSRKTMRFVKKEPWEK